MSGSLVPAGAQFVQQGAVDWVALSVHFTVAVLSRLSRAGIDPLTLQVGRAICFNFALEPNGQERISTAILKLKRYGSYGDLIWFGFGIREIITDLADTEEGLTLVALCAALSTTYDTLFTAKVLRELCVLCKAPQTFSPALRQWKALAELCAGILTSAHFMNLVNGFRRLISGSSSHAVETRCTPTTPSALAEAILTVARISKHNLINAVFSGGPDCAWLAAFAEWMLSLDVGICDHNGLFLYRSRGGVEDLPSVTILVSDRANDMPRDSLLQRKVSVIPSGHSLMQKDPALRGVSVLNWQGSWSNILHDVFHRDIDALLDGDTGLHFATLLKCVSTLPPRNFERYSSIQETTTLQDYWSNHPVNPLLSIHQYTRSPGYLEFAARRMPELCACLSVALPLPHTGIAELGRNALGAIEAACLCAFHGGRDETSVNFDNHICLHTMAEAIIVYLWILIDADIDDDVHPSITGLANLYSWQSRANKTPGLANGPWYQTMMSCDYPALGINLVFHVLSGVSVLGTPPKLEAIPTIENLARVGNGICVYYCGIEDPALSPESIFRVRVVRGYISHSGFRFEDLCGLKSVNMADGLEFDDFLNKPTIRSVQTLVQETGENGLEMAYRLHYLAKNGEISTHWLHLPLLFRKLQRYLRAPICRDHDKPLDESERFSQPRYDYSGKLIGVCFPDKKSVDDAQKFLADFGAASTLWVLTHSQTSCAIVLGQPLLLYAMIGPLYKSLVSFTNCLGCIMSSALDPRSDFGSFRPSNEPLYSLTLTSSERSQAVVRWTSMDDDMID